MFPIPAQVFVGRPEKGEGSKNIFPSQEASGPEEQMWDLEGRQAASWKWNNPRLLLSLKHVSFMEAA